MKRAVVAVVALVLLVGVTPDADAAAHAAGYHWKRTSNPFTVTYVGNVQSKWVDALNKAARRWSRSDVLDVRVTSGNSSHSYRQSCPYAQGKVNVCNFPYGNTGWAGLTEVHFTSPGNHITAARIKLNDSVTSATNRLPVICHEMGHGLGLAHNDAGDNSCLVPTVDPSLTRPDASDYAMLDSIYSHLDSAAAPQGEQMNYQRMRVIRSGSDTTVQWFFGR